MFTFDKSDTCNTSVSGNHPHIPFKLPHCNSFILAHLDSILLHVDSIMAPWLQFDQKEAKWALTDHYVHANFSFRIISPNEIWQIWQNFVTHARQGLSAVYCILLSIFLSILYLSTPLYQMCSSRHNENVHTCAVLVQKWTLAGTVNEGQIQT